MTAQKKLVYDIVRESTEHPSAEMIYRVAKEREPTIAMGTVYRNLGILEREEKIRRIAIANAPDRFDRTLSDHDHILCRCCGRLVDLSPVFSGISARNVERESGFCEVRGRMLFTGICRFCLEERDNSEQMLPTANEMRKIIIHEKEKEKWNSKGQEPKQI